MTLRSLARAPITAALFVLAAGAVVVHHGRVTGDEGWYLLAAKSVQEGQVPYRDFLFTQMPLLPYLYGVALGPVGVGLIVGRWVSLVMGAAAVVAVGAACRRVGGTNAGTIAALLLASNANFLYTICSVKTQAATVLFTALALWCAAGAPANARRTALGLIAMNLAVAARLSMLPALAMMWVFVLATHRHRLRAWSAGLLTNAFLGAILVSAFDSGGRFRFGVLEFHREYYGHAAWAPRYFLEFAKGTLANQLVLIGLVVWAIGWALRARLISKGGDAAVRSPRAFLLLALVSYASTTLIHAAQPVSYAIYQVSNVAFAVVFAAIVLERALAKLPERRGRWVRSALAVAMLASIPLQECPIDEKGAGSPSRTRDAARAVRALAEPGDRVLTLQTAVALEAGLPVLRGYEMSEFGYFPSMDAPRAEHLRVVNRRRLWGDVAARAARIVCFTPRDFTILAAGDADGLRRHLSERYELRSTIEGYGQFHEPLYIAVAKQLAPTDTAP